MTIRENISKLLKEAMINKDITLVNLTSFSAGL